MSPRTATAASKAANITSNTQLLTKFHNVSNKNKRKAEGTDNDDSEKKRSAAGPMSISFSSPTPPREQETFSLQFPPTIFLDAKYSNGVALPRPVTVTATANSDNDTLSTPLDRCYFSSGPHTQPCLSQADSQLWLQKYAADATARSHFPVQVGRLLGTITRSIIVDKKHAKGKTPHSFISPHRPPITLNPKENKLNPISKPKSIKEARKELDEEGAEFETDELYTAAVEQRSAEIRNAWKEKHQGGRCWRQPTWDAKCGHLNVAAVNDPNYVPVVALLRFINSTKASDAHAGEVCELYNGLRKIPSDTRSVLHSLFEMSSPEGLYKTPLLISYPIVTKMVEASSSKRTRYSIQIGVYANRLLPEVMTERDLHIVMSSLDAGSFRVTEPLHLPLTISTPVFASSPLPKVVIEDDKKPAAIDTHAESDSDDDESVVSINEDNNVIDLTIGDSTRDENTVSAFTVKGLLKLLEHQGNDVSNWPALETKLRDKFLLQLMLHQQHAICWMYQMEHLGGMGINSIIWEEREFLDGGKYYYSPALGQIRLDRPHTMKGGLLCDEMGLGKTMEILGLILATMDETKQEAQQARESGAYDESILHMHATLIIVPPALVSQWIAEIQKATGDALVVEFFDHKNGDRFLNSKRPGECCNHYVTKEQPDVVITTYQALEKPASARQLVTRSWGRIVLDEMQEIRSSTTSIARNCDKLICQRRRWMLSGTPLFEGVDDLRGELNFLSLEPFCAKTEDGFFNYSILNHWNHESVHGLETLRILGLLMLRRSKDMTVVATGQPLLGLNPLTVDFIPVPQRPSERALYCFLEYIVAEELASLGDENARDGNSRKTCLRLLRETCVSTVLLNGGMGVSSQLTILNNLLIRKHRRDLVGSGAPKTADSGTSSKNRIFSCGEAIRYLSQVQEEVYTDAGFVSGMSMGTGGGMAQRNRATESPAQRIAEAKEKLAKAAQAIDTESSKRARARWHLALERITTGCFVEYPTTVGRDFVALWRWRFATIATANSNATETGTSLPPVLLRGWRPCPTFVQDLRAAHPHAEFAWAHPGALLLKGIPCEVLVHELREALGAVVDEEHGDSPSDLPHVVAFRFGGKWNAIVAFKNVEDAQHVGRKAATTKGIELPCRLEIPSVAKVLQDAKASYGQAKAEHDIYPTTASAEKFGKAKQALVTARLGLRIFAENKNGSINGNVELCRALRVCRTQQPSKSHGLLQQASVCIETANNLIARNVAARDVALADIRRYEQASEISDEVKAMSAYESLQALASKDENETTWCPICMGALGSTKKEVDARKKIGLVTLTSCGHLFCQTCLDGFRESRDGISVPCPSCRKPLDSVSKTVLVDPSITRDDDDLEKKRAHAKSVIQQAATMLHSSNGQLDSEMWEKLYLSFDLPLSVSNRGDTRLTATPKEVLQHLRAATGLETNSRPAITGSISSKIQALIADLPRNERSVVFSSSHISIQHLLSCLGARGLAFQALYTGQHITAQEEALDAWKAADLSCPILVVQSGAAASGLTLTAASKMFLLEPFVRHEEEKQAYARCHRYGQEKPVHVKCYYTPVSVESRLLEWRKLSSSEAVQSDATIRFSSMDVDDNDAYDEEEKKEEELLEEVPAEEDLDQTLYLLGLK